MQNREQRYNKKMGYANKWGFFSEIIGNNQKWVKKNARLEVARTIHKQRGIEKINNKNTK